MEDTVDLVRLAFRVHALNAELEELEHVLNQVVAPGLRRATTSLHDIEVQLRELAGVEQIDVQAAARAADSFDVDVGGGAEPDATDVE